MVSRWLLLFFGIKLCSRRSSRLVNTFEQLLGGEELYHYHSKLMMKEVVCTTMMVMVMVMVIFTTQAETGGQHVWHQDYGYWCLKI